MADDPDIAIVEAAHGSELYASAQLLREAVLRTPLGLTLTEAELEDDARRQHFCAAVRGVVVGAVSLKFLGEAIVQLKQMAVAEDCRGRGIGAQIMAFAEAWAARQGQQLIVLHARIDAEGFYARFGYDVEGKNFVENTIPHIRMVKRLDRPFQKAEGDERQ